MALQGSIEERIRRITREVLRELAGARPEPKESEPLIEASGAGAQGIRLVVFDMAGTTVQDDDRVLKFMMKTVEKHRIRATAEEVNAFMGGSKRQVFQHFLQRQHGAGARTDELLETAYADFQKALEDDYRRGHVAPIAGAEETFRWLRGRGIRVATTTGFYRQVTDIILQRLGWDRGLVDASICVDDVARGRPAPYMIFEAMSRLGVDSVHQVIKVGDTPFDMLEGHNAGTRGIIGVLTGAHKAESFGRVRHTHVLPSVRELPALIESEF